MTCLLNSVFFYSMIETRTIECELNRISEVEKMTRILLAEDEEVLRMLIEDIFEDKDYNIDVAASITATGRKMIIFHEILALTKPKFEQRCKNQHSPPNIL